MVNFTTSRNLHKGEAIDVVRTDGKTAIFAVDGVQKANASLTVSGR